MVDHSAAQNDRHLGAAPQAARARESQREQPSFHQVLTRLDFAMSRRTPLVLGWRDDESGEYREAECQLLYFLDNGPVFSVLARSADGGRMRIAIDSICAFPKASASLSSPDQGHVLAYPL